MLTPTESYELQLADGLVLRSVVDDRDVERVAAFNGAIHGPGVADMTRELIRHHPHTRPEHWLFVEDETTSVVVSSLCLIPWTWRYEDVQLRCGEMGIVGTLEPYRHRGLIRAQAARHQELLREGGYDLGMIQGIPYFYRQFDYEYAVPLEGGWRIEPHLIPEPHVEKARRYHFREATIDDLETLARLDPEMTQDLAISVVRDPSIWRYLLTHSRQTEMTAETWLVIDAQDQAVGYVRIPRHGFGEGLIVNEALCSRHDVASAVLHWLKGAASDRGKPFVRLCLPTRSPLVQTARYLGAHDLGNYAWQIHIVDIGRLLQKLGPVFERRLATSPFSGLTQALCFNLYRQAFELCFDSGTLIAVRALGFCDRADVRLPPHLAAPLTLGYHTRDQLAASHPDVSVRRECQYLVDVLFPQVDSFVYTIY